MILKLLRSVFILTITGMVAYYVIHKDHNHKTTANITNIENSSWTIEYKKNINNGTLTITAKSSKKLDENNIFLSDVLATFNRDEHTSTISCKTCNYKPNEQKAYLNNDVCIKSADTVCYTDAAIVDFVQNSINGDSKMHGTRAGTNFVSEGFVMKENGKITLKRAKIIKGSIHK